MNLQLSDLIHSVIIEVRGKRHIFDQSHLTSRGNELLINLKSDIYLDDLEAETGDGRFMLIEARVSLVTIIKLRFESVDLVAETFNFSLSYVHNEPWIHSMKRVDSNSLDFDDYDFMQRRIYNEILNYYALTEDELDGNVHPALISIYR